MDAIGYTKRNADGTQTRWESGAIRRQAIHGDERRGHRATRLPRRSARHKSAMGGVHDAL